MFQSVGYYCYFGIIGIIIGIIGNNYWYFDVTRENYTNLFCKPI